MMWGRYPHIDTSPIQRLGMFAFSPFILQEAIQKLKHNHGTDGVSYHSTNLLRAKPKYA
jgi:hypothetical protein